MKGLKKVAIATLVLFVCLLAVQPVTLANHRHYPNNFYPNYNNNYNNGYVSIDYLYPNLSTIYDGDSFAFNYNIRSNIPNTVYFWINGHPANPSGVFRLPPGRYDFRMEVVGFNGLRTYATYTVYVQQRFNCNYYSNSNNYYNGFYACNSSDGDDKNFWRDLAICAGIIALLN